MAERGPGGVLPIGLVAFAAIVYSIMPGSAPTPATAKTAASIAAAASAVPEPSSPDRDPLKPLQEFLNARTGEQQKEKVFPGSPAPDTCGPLSYQIHFLVATVPDPLDSHLAQNFDRAVDAIQHSVQDNGYVLDRLFLPWKKDTETGWDIAVRGSPKEWLPAKPPPSGKDVHLASAMTKSPAGDLHRKVPGMLLFRESSPDSREPQKLLVVFLVGEIPTSGIQREAFTRALDAIVRCEKLECTPACAMEKIAILGPYFSGSADSLRATLFSWNKNTGQIDRRGISILSGSATVARNRDVLGDWPGAPFRATVIPDDALTREFYNFVPSLGIKPTRDMALFVEGSTSYGSASAMQTLNKVHLTFQFPLHVSQLRGAYEKDEALKSGGVLSRGPRRTLEVPLDPVEGNPRDILPPQDPRMTSAVAELSLAASIEMIRREHIRMVGIIATDPRDILFLARKIREARANVILFTLGADILYAHPDYQRYLRGMLIVTPYPLFPLNQEWTGAGAKRIAFSGSSEEGIYNAVSLILVDFATTSGPPSKRTLSDVEIIEYDAPLRPALERPPVWITAVGRGGFWPVAFERNYNDGGYVRRFPGQEPRTENERANDSRGASGEEARTRQHWPPGAFLSFLFVDALFAILVLFYFHARLPGKWGGYRLADELFSAWSQTIPATIGRVYAVVLFTIAFLVQMTIVAWFWKAKAFLPDGRAAQVGSVVGPLLLLFLATIVLSELVQFLLFDRREHARYLDERRDHERSARERPELERSERERLKQEGSTREQLDHERLARERLEQERMVGERLKRERWARVNRWGHFVAPALMIGVLSRHLIAYLREIWGMSEERLLAFSSRALDLTSTLSPVLPFLLTMLLLVSWAVCNLQRAFLLEIQGALPPKAPIKFASFGGAERLYLSVTKSLRSTKTRLWVLLIPFLGLAPFYQLVTRAQTTIDGARWSDLLHWLLIAGYFLIVYTFALFVLLWVRLKRLLQRLALHPFVDAFRRLPESCAASPWKLWSEVPNLTTLAASVLQLRALTNLSKGHVDGDYFRRLEKKAEEAERFLSKTLVEGPESFSSSIGSRLELRKVLLETTELLLERLERLWERWPMLAQRVRPLPKLEADSQALGTPAWIRREIPSGLEIWVRAAEEFIALRTSTFVRIVFQHMKSLLSFVFAGFFLIVAAISSYPFEPKHSVMTLVWVVVLISICLIAWVFVGMERDPVLSYIGKTEPGKVTLSLDFVSSIGIYVVVPLLTLVATQFPGLGDVVFSIFSPAMRSLSH